MCFRKGKKQNRSWFHFFFRCQIHTTNVHPSCLELKKKYLQAIKGMITHHPLFLSLGFFFLLPFWIARLHTVLNSFSPLPAGFSRWREMSTAFRANALWSITSAVLAGRGLATPASAQLSLAMSLAQHPWVVFADSGHLQVDEGVSPESQSSEPVI